MRKKWPTFNTRLRGKIAIVVFKSLNAAIRKYDMTILLFIYSVKQVVVYKGSEIYTDADLITIGAGINAAAGTRLALQWILVKGFKLYSFQLRDLFNSLPENYKERK